MQRVIITLGLVALGVFAGHGCNEDEPPGGQLAPSCEVDDDCDAPFVCGDGACLQPCSLFLDADRDPVAVGECIDEGCEGDVCCVVRDVEVDPDPEASIEIHGYCELGDEPPVGDSGDGGGDDDECSSNSDCGSREKCNGGRCVSVECTTDSHCGSCERCSSNVCRDCGEGPYGCYC